MSKKTVYWITVGAFVCCVALILVGAYLDIQILSYVGVGLLFGGAFLLSIVGVIIMFVRARKQANEMDKSKDASAQDSEQDSEQDSQNRYSEATGAFAYTIHGFRHSSILQKILMILFLLFTVGSVLAGLVLLFFHQMLAAYICFGVFGGVILIGIVSAIIASHVGK